jgi:PAS domain S-box-containing protein
MSVRRLTWLAGLTLLYVGAGKLGLSLAFAHVSASAVWPPAGVALAALLLGGRRLWPAIALGAFIVNFTTTGDVLSSVAIAGGNTLEALVGAALLARVGGAAALRRASGVFAIAGLAVPIAAAIAATVGVASLWLSGLAGPEALPFIWLTWWLGDTTGAILVLPLGVLWWEEPRLHWERRQAIEATLLGAALLLTCLVLFRGLVPSVARGYPLAFFVLPALLWAAFRFGQRETATVAALLAAFAIWGTLDGNGPFADLPVAEALLILQAFVGVVTVAMLAASAEVAERAATDRALVGLNRELEARVASRTDLLARTQARLVEAQQVAHIGSWEWDVPGNSLWWSEELYRIYGVDPARFAASYEGFLALVHPDDRAETEATVRTALDARAPFSFEHRIVRPDGSVRRLHGQGSVVCDAGGRPLRMLGTGQDITERRRAEEERARFEREQHARREAEAANEAKDQFLALLSHELRTPVNAVMGWAQLLQQQTLDEQAREKAVAAIYRNASIQTRLVADLLDASRIRAGTMRLEIAPLDLSAVARDAVETVRPMARAKDMEIAVELSAISLEGDAERLGQVLRNLLLNAVKFGSSGGCVTLRCGFSEGEGQGSDVTAAGTDCGDRGVVITVEDDGPGISDAFLPHLFEQFRQADPSMTREHQGLGLGLAIVKQIVTLHGGTVEATNRQDGRGAIFTVRLPQPADAQQAAGVDPRRVSM